MFQNVKCIRETTDQVTAHTDILTPLSGENKCYFPGGFRTAVKNILKVPCRLSTVGFKGMGRTVTKGCKVC